MLWKVGESPTAVEFAGGVMRVGVASRAPLATVSSLVSPSFLTLQTKAATSIAAKLGPGPRANGSGRAPTQDPAGGDPVFRGPQRGRDPSDSTAIEGNLVKLVARGLPAPEPGSCVNTP